MVARRDQVDCEFLSPRCTEQLNYQQQILFTEHWEDLIDHLWNEGKNPERNEGYARSSVRPIARRVFQVFEYAWQRDDVTFELTRTHADHFLRDLNEGSFRTNQGREYSEGSKRKFSDALESYFRFKGEEWDPAITFSDGEPTLNSDPFTKPERRRIFTAALEHNSPPKYKNVCPEERDRWNTHLAQELGEPKSEIGPGDWDELRRCWKIPSLISTAQDAAMRAALVGRLDSNHLNLDAGKVEIPPEVAVKNDRRWTCELSHRSVTLLRKWRDQRAKKSKYDNSTKLWLNRKGNPYGSNTLNNLLANLIDEAGIEEGGRKLTWHSIRHSTGMYVYNEERDLELVAEILRQKSLEAAKQYAHPTPETKTDIVESIQGGR